MPATTAAAARKIVTSAVEQRQARQLLSRLGTEDPWAVRDADDLRTVPAELSAVLTAIVDSVARGDALTVGGLPDELTTTAAAELLGVSRPTLMKLVTAGDLPAHRVGTHTRLRSADVLAYRDARLLRQRRAFDELREWEDRA